MPSKKLFLLDAFALIYRAHFAFSKNPRINSKGINTGAILGFTNTVLEIIQKEKPTHIGIAFDTPEPTFRHTAYPDYKAQRQAQPEDITIAIPYIIRLCQAFQIPILRVVGFEADDVVGTLAKKAVQKDFEIFMMTSDKDYSQLVQENIWLYKPAFLGKEVEIMGVKEVLEKWQIKRVEQVIDILGLQGDAVDNIPGLPSVGEKTAVKLIDEFDSIENMVANAHKLKGKLQETVKNFGQQALLSKQLATIDINVPIEMDEEALFYKGFDRNLISQLFDELEFRTLKKRLLGEEKTETQTKPSTTQTQGFDLFNQNTPPNQHQEESQEIAQKSKNYQNTVCDYHVINTPELRKNLVDFLKIQKEICLDTETTSLEIIEAQLVGFSFAYRPKEAFFVPIPQDQNQAQKIVEEFREVFENEHITKIGQNIKYDLAVLKNYGIELKGKFFDTMLAHYLIDPDTRHSMDVLAENYLNYSPIPIDDLIGKKGKNQGNMADVSLEKIVPYACEDADITLQLKALFEPQLTQNQLTTLFEEVENPLIEVLADIERNGVKINENALFEFSKELEKDILEIEQKIYKEAGTTFNIASPKQLGDILFEKLHLDKKAKKTKTGQYATGEEVLVKLAEEHQIVRDILDFREIQKLKSTYIDALPKLVAKDGLIHTSYNQAVAATGRLSSTNPNLQNIPIRTEKGREIRKAFVPRSADFLIMSADYSQIELRIMAAFSQDAAMLEAFRQKRDIHTATAAKIFKVEIDQVDSDMRRKAKTANFGIIYGISVHGLSQRLNIPRGEAKLIIDAYFTEFPAVKTYMDSIIQFATEHEYVETILKRRRYLRDINSRNFTQKAFAERNAINAPIQGSAADLIKIAMIHIHKYLKTNNLQTKMIMQVHDELVFEVHKSELDFVKPEIIRLMETAFELPVPLVAEAGIGENWLVAH